MKEATQEGITPVESSQGMSDEAIVQKYAGKSQNELVEMVLQDKTILPELERLATLIETNAMQVPEETAAGSESTESTTETASGTSGQSSQQSDDGIVVDEEVDVKINPTWLGDYAKGRSLSDAVRELAKGKEEANRTIDFFKTHKVPNLERAVEAEKATAASLKKELDEWKKKGGPIAGLDEIDLPEEIDYFDPDHQSLLDKTLKAIREAKKANSAGTEQSTRQTQETTTETTPQVQTVDVDREYAEIRMLQAHPDFQKVLSTKTDIKELDTQYSEFIANLAQVAGISAYDDKGVLTTEMRSALTAYNDENSVRGKQIRSVCSQYEIKPPEELPVLHRIYTIRSLKSAYARRDNAGNALPIDYEEAGRLFVAQNPNLLNDTKTNDLQSAIDENERRERAIENRKQFARDPKASDGGDPRTAEVAEFDDFNRLMQKPRSQYNEPEKLQVRDYLKKFAQMSDSEIDAWFRR